MSTTDNNTGSFANIFDAGGGGGGGGIYGGGGYGSTRDIRVTAGETPDEDHISLSLTDGTSVLVDTSLLKDKLIEHTSDITVAQATADWAAA